MSILVIGLGKLGYPMAEFLSSSQLNIKAYDTNKNLINKLKKGSYNGIILSYAGIKYLDLENEISEIFSVETIIPSVGQGIIALQCRDDDEKIISILKKINHEETYKRAHAEIDILKILEGDCQTAVGAYSTIENEKNYLGSRTFFFRWI